MKFSPNRRVAVAIFVSGGLLALRAELNKWAENIDAGNRLEAVFFRSVNLPNGAVPVRRPPKETRPALGKLIDAAPRDAELYSLRALEAEQQLDFAAAEADWKKYVELAADRGAARLALADFYHRRLKPQDEFGALAIAAVEAPPAAEKLVPETQQRSWKTYERLFKLLGEQRLDPATLGVPQYWAWIARYPRQPILYRNFFEFVLSHNQSQFGEDVVNAYERAFPSEPEFPVEARATLAARRGTPADAIAVYERSFRPLWDPALVTKFFALLKQSNGLRAYLERTRTAVTATPLEIVPAAKLFYYWQQQGNVLPGERALIEFRQRKEARKSAWTADELLTLGRLFELSHNYDEAARNYYAMYAAAGTDNSAAETALASLTRLLLSLPEQPIRFGASNLALYRDVATMDPHPGFLNGILSLILNNTDPAGRYADEERDAGPYFRRAKAAELVALFESRFPASSARAELRERLIDAYAVHGSGDGVIRAGTSFLRDFPNAPNRAAVALRMADAYARQNQPQPEFVLYDSLLDELSKKADRVPLGATPGAPPAQQNPRQPAASQVRSPGYARVLDRYVARLVAMKRLPDALALYRREIDRNADDPGLYDVLAAFLEQNRLGAETEQVYQQAISHFEERSWSQKLARWYLRQRRAADMARLTRDV
ncbi:MAG TPA: hypothetical protein VGP79_04915, partial [Bryobacteraceae bacterium]|nr:hypothetical protein [Bryobacteraceae bacterium]